MICGASFGQLECLLLISVYLGSLLILKLDYFLFKELNSLYILDISPLF
jgi:hypothetical protein